MLLLGVSCVNTVLGQILQDYEDYLCILILTVG